MDDALDGMFDIITGAAEYTVPAPADNIAQDDENAAINEILGIEPPVINIPVRPLMIEVYPFDPESNMVNFEIR